MSTVFTYSTTDLDTYLSENKVVGKSYSGGTLTVTSGSTNQSSPGVITSSDFTVKHGYRYKLAVTGKKNTSSKVFIYVGTPGGVTISSARSAALTTDTSTVNYEFAVSSDGSYKCGVLIESPAADDSFEITSMVLTEISSASADLDNYVDLTSTQAITGQKTFNTLYASDTVTLPALVCTTDAVIYGDLVASDQITAGVVNCGSSVCTDITALTLTLTSDFTGVTVSCTALTSAAINGTDMTTHGGVMSTCNVLSDLSVPELTVNTITGTDATLDRLVFGTSDVVTYFQSSDNLVGGSALATKYRYYISNDVAGRRVKSIGVYLNNLDKETTARVFRGSDIVGTIGTLPGLDEVGKWIHTYEGNPVTVELSDAIVIEATSEGSSIIGGFISTGAFTIDGGLSLGQRIYGETVDTTVAPVLGGVSFDYPYPICVTSNDAILLPTGSTSDRPTANQDGLLRFNTTLSNLECCNSSNWVNVHMGNTITTQNLNAHTIIATDITADTITEISDARVKSNVRPISSALDMVNTLEGVRFTDRRGRERIGLIAQDVNSVVPEVVHVNSDGFYTLSYGELTALLIQAVKELAALKSNNGNNGNSNGNGDSSDDE